ncbi:hypothetical protein Trydic_g17353 [Trypoxylus dichotomus]
MRRITSRRSPESNGGEAKLDMHRLVLFPFFDDIYGKRCRNVNDISRTEEPCVSEGPGVQGCRPESRPPKSGNASVFDGTPGDGSKVKSVEWSILRCGDLRGTGSAVEKKNKGFPIVKGSFLELTLVYTSTLIEIRILPVCVENLPPSTFTAIHAEDPDTASAGVNHIGGPVSLRDDADIPARLPVALTVTGASAARRRDGRERGGSSTRASGRGGPADERTSAPSIVDERGNACITRIFAYATV